MTLPLAGRCAIVTGGGRGLGRVMALALARDGADVFITGARQPDELADTLEALRATGVRAGQAVADVSDEGACREVAAAAEALFGHVDILINNAARGGAEQRADYRVDRQPRFWEAEPDGFARMVATNMVGPFLMTRAVLPGMLARGHGRIVNISTSRSTMLWSGGGPYGPCKAALEASSRIWAKELEGSGITVNVLLPGRPCDTALIPGGPVGSRAIDYRPGSEPAGREGNVPGLLPPWIMGPPVAWIASDAAAGVTGRRFVARDWDDALPPADAADRALARSRRRRASSEPGLRAIRLPMPRPGTLRRPPGPFPSAVRPASRSRRSSL